MEKESFYSLKNQKNGNILLYSVQESGQKGYWFRLFEWKKLPFFLIIDKNIMAILPEFST